MTPSLMQIGNRNYLTENGSVSVFNRHQLTACAKFLPHFHDQQQWLSFGYKLSQEMTFVTMEVSIDANCHSMPILTKPPREV